MTAPTPQRCLAAADQLLRGAGLLGAAAVTPGWWPRACACLIRPALACGVDTYWRRVNPTVAACLQVRAKQSILRRRLRRASDTEHPVPCGRRAPPRTPAQHAYAPSPTAPDIARHRTLMDT
ncbi:hypothetical protein, partial [Micromonospora noduli]|uniref:hypothetical protein n=1 Tax=Micromonospora noduli TaxID=709876 RepID=UPI001C65A303